MKFVKLLSYAFVNGVGRSPAEGVLHLEDEEADRLIADQLGEDVSADFSAKQDRDAPVEHVTTVTGDAASSDAASEHPHQSEVAPQATDAATPPKPRKGAAAKE